MSNFKICSYTKIRDNIWHIEDENGVYCTLIMGSELAMLIDTGYGQSNLREFIEGNIVTPYIVVNSCGYPDHTGGNNQFKYVYALKREWEVINHFAGQEKSFELLPINMCQRISLGDLTVKVVDLRGHTKASVGFLVIEEELLVAGDALGEEIQLFGYGSLSVLELHQTLKQAIKMNFSTYICGHSNKEYCKDSLSVHMQNIKNLCIDENARESISGVEVYTSCFENSYGKSKIVFSENNTEIHSYCDNANCKK